MIDLDYLAKLLALLESKGVSSIKTGDLALEFHMEQSKEKPQDTKDHTIEVPIDESTLPPDLRTDAITNYDAILNWSGTPDPTDAQMPLTGDEPLSGAM